MLPQVKLKREHVDRGTLSTETVNCMLQRKREGSYGLVFSIFYRNHMAFWHIAFHLSCRFDKVPVDNDITFML